MVLKGFINIYSTTFPGLSNKIQGVHFLRHIFFCHSHADKRIPVSANNFRKTTDNSYSLSFPAQKLIFCLTQPDHLACPLQIQGSYKQLPPFFKDFSRTTLDFQGPPTRNTISQIVQKCTFSVYSNKAFRLELFASPTSLHFQFTCLKLIVDYCIKH